MIRETLRLVIGSADRRATLALGGAVCVMLVGCVLVSLAPLALKNLVDRMSGAGGASIASHLVWPGIAYVACLCLGRLLGEWRLVLSGSAEQRLHANLCTKFYAHLLDLPLSFHLNQRTGAVARTVTQAASASQVLVASSLSLAATVVEVGTAIVVLSSFSDATVVYLLPVSALAYLLVFVGSSASHRRHVAAVSATSMDTSAKLADGLLNVEAIKSFRAQERTCLDFANLAAVLEQRWLALQRHRALTGSALTLVFAGTVSASLWVAASGVAAGTLSVGAFVMVSAYVLQLVRPLEQLGTAWRDLSQASEFVRPMLDTLRQQGEAQSMRLARLTGPACTTPAEEPKVVQAASLRFVDVHHAYSADRPVLAGLNLDIPAGRTIALVGASGCGKSTIVRLAVRLVEPHRGSITLNGVPLSNIPVDILRHEIAVVGQDTALLDASVAANIALARPDASHRELEEAARGAHLHDFIVSLPAGYDTPVGERGLRLSGGQRQRIAIARVLLARPRIVLLDEATSMLDAHTERHVLQGIDDQLQECTTLIVTHRLASAQQAHEIVLIAGGSVAERGSHDDLLARRGLYFGLWQAQSTGHAQQAEPSRIDTGPAAH